MANAVKLDRLSRSRSDWDWAYAFTCPACRRYNGLTSAGPVVDFRCKYCGIAIDASDAVVEDGPDLG